MKHVPEYNLYWPDFEGDPRRELVRMMKRVNDCDAVAEHVRTCGIAVQAGGHIGLWPRQLAKYFTLVHTFEPIPEMLDCLLQNTLYSQNIVVHPQGLADTAGKGRFVARDGGRSKRIDESGGPEVALVTIDSLDLPRCDLIYLDVERDELRALAGARETLANYRPVLALEVLDGEEANVRRWADMNRYAVVGNAHADWILTPR